MDRKDSYFKQRLTQADLDGMFAAAEQGEWNQRKDWNFYGVLNGLVPTLSGASSVQVTSGIAVDQLGKRIKAFYDGTGSKIQSYTTITAGTATSVTAGQERWIAVYAKFGRNALDPRVDGNGVTVYFDQQECVHDGTSTAPALVAGLGGTGVDKFFVEMGTMAATGTATRPTLRTDSILICDILRTPSDASNTISTTRRMLFNLTDTAVAGSTGMAMLMTAFTAWLGGRTNTAQTSLHAQIDKIFTDLAATTASDDGAERIGAAAGTNLTAGSVRSQIDELDAEKGGLALANTWAAVNTLSTRLRVTPTTATPAIDVPTVASSGRELLFEFTYGGTFGKLRIYLNDRPIIGSKVYQNSILITQNARWDGTNWNLDDTSGAGANESSSATAFEFGGNTNQSNVNDVPWSPGFILYKKPFGSGISAWTDAGFTWIVDTSGTLDYFGAQTTKAGIGSGAVGTNRYNWNTGQMFIGMNSIVLHEVGMTAQATGAFTARVIHSFTNQYLATPSTVTVNSTPVQTNCGAGSATVTTKYVSVTTSVTGAGTYDFRAALSIQT
jgi:hypothetical protein